MEIKLLRTKDQIKVNAKIDILTFAEVPLKKDGWGFDWAKLIKTEGADFFKITLKGSPKTLEGILMLSIYFEEMVYMNNLELAPQNIGKNKQLDYVAGCLIAYGCKYSLERGKGNYLGYLTFESKTKLIPWYAEKYGATQTLGNKMFIDPFQGKNLINQYLGL